MNDQEFQELKEELEATTLKLRALDEKYMAETGARFVMPVRLNGNYGNKLKEGE